MLHFLVNPTSRSGAGRRLWNTVERELKQRGLSYELHLLQGPGDAAHVAASLTGGDSDETIILLGGDGTINEFVNGVLSFEHLTLGVIPTGSGNDFARSLKLPKKPSKAVDCIEAFLKGRGRTASVNVGQTTQTSSGLSRFAVSSGFGYDAQVCYEQNQSKSKSLLNALHLGKLSYTFGALALLFKIGRFPLDLELFGCPQVQHEPKRALQQTGDSDLPPVSLHFDKVYFAAAMNNRYEGGGFLFCPKADPTDDVLDLILVEGMSPLKILFVLPTAYFGGHVHFKGVHTYQCKKAALCIRYDQTDIHAANVPASTTKATSVHVPASTEKACVHTDGEITGFEDAVSFALLPEHLHVIVP